MTKRIKRRDFLKHGVNIGITSAIGFSFLSGAKKTSRPENTLMTEIAVVEGPDALQNTKKAVELLGGMKTFVPEGARVALLPNSQSRHPGTFTNPEVIRAGIRMCKAAGAGEVSCLSWLPKKFWDGSGLGKVVEEEGALLKLVGMENDYYKTVPLPNGIALKKAMIMKELYNHDILIDMPVIKDHAGNKFTGTMKNLMGLNSPSCNRTFHKKNWDTDTNALEHLDQCIADLNLAIKPRLCLVDATVILASNGPFGPGKLLYPNKVVAGVDRVAIDAYCTTLLGLKPNDIIMIKRGFEHGLGEIDLTKVKVRKIQTKITKE